VGWGWGCRLVLRGGQNWIGELGLWWGKKLNGDGADGLNSGGSRRCVRGKREGGTWGSRGHWS
jgi:hypothetical protein